MKFSFFSTAFIALILTFISCKKQEGTNMYVKGRHLYTANHEKVILRGVNEMFVWCDDPTGLEILSEIAKTGANGVRLVWTTEGNPEDLDQLIQNSLQNNMIPMVELHDATGDWSKLPIIIRYWKNPAVKKVIDKYKKWLLINIANEVGMKTVDSVFVAHYTNAITELRNFGYDMPLIIDAPDWGKDEKVITRTWKSLLNHDPLKNVMFSVHTYWVDSSASERLNHLIAEVVRDTIPFLFGEGPQPVGWDCTTPFPYEYCMEICEQNEIGWLAWSWGAMNNGDCGEKSAFDMTTDGIYGNWNNTWGQLITVGDQYSIQQTSEIPPSLIKTSIE